MGTMSLELPKVDLSMWNIVAAWLWKLFNLILEKTGFKRWLIMAAVVVVGFMFFVPLAIVGIVALIAWAIVNREKIKAYCRKLRDRWFGEKQPQE